MFDYVSAVRSAKLFNRLPGFVPTDENYGNICEWLKGLPDIFRINMHSYLVVAKELPDSDEFSVMAEYHYKSKLVVVYFPHKIDPNKIY